MKKDDSDVAVRLKKNDAKNIKIVPKNSFLAPKLQFFFTKSLIFTRYIPLLSDRKSGFMMLRDTKPTEEEDLVEANFQTSIFQNLAPKSTKSVQKFVFEAPKL